MEPSEKLGGRGSQGDAVFRAQNRAEEGRDSLEERARTQTHTHMHTHTHNLAHDPSVSPSLRSNLRSHTGAAARSLGPWSAAVLRLIAFV